MQAECGVKGDPLLPDTVATAGINGRALFQAHCASCHDPFKNNVGPRLAGVRKQWSDTGWGYRFTRNPARMIAEGDKRAIQILNEWGKAQMTAFPMLTDAELYAIFEYADAQARR